MAVQQLRELPATSEPRSAEAARAGFGAETVSIPGAAVRTIKLGMDNARETVPTVEDVRAELRARLAREREARASEDSSGDERAGEIDAAEQRDTAAEQLIGGSEISRYSSTDAAADAEPDGSSFDILA